MIKLTIPAILLACLFTGMLGASEPEDWTPLFAGRTLSGLKAPKGARSLTINNPSELPRRDPIDNQMARLLEKGIPVVDFHVHLKGGLTIAEVQDRTRRTGVFNGVALNCGLGFPTTNDRGIETFIKSMAGQPVFLGMQAEGREWPRLFSPGAIAQFDYVFTDAMTIIDHRGRRARLWIKSEVDIPDKQAFMDLLVKTIENILDSEPIDIYVNPLYLPEAIARDFDQLWTPQRQRRVIEALVRNKVALEISNSLRLPKPALIKMAKKAGVKFTFGTNNGDRRLGRLEYGLQMVKECGLAREDLWMPRPEGQKPIQVRKRVEGPTP
jgi:hypothetical protein